MKYLFIILLLLVDILSAYSIDEMLELYRKDSDLSKQTKNESLGHLTIYTRDDIERMQAHKLQDLLNSLRSFRYDENLLGMPDTLHLDPLLYASDVVKVFVNNHEITSAFAGSGLFIYGNMDLGFVDHVEIYEGSTSTNVNSEPSMVTIKLYTKSPNRELGSHLFGYIGSRATNHENISYAGIDDNLEYYVYLSRTDTNREEYIHEGYKLSRNYEDLHALVTLKYNNLTLDTDLLKRRMDPFLSTSMFALPKDGEIGYLYGRVSSSMTFLEDDSLKLSLSFMRIDGSLDLAMDKTRWSHNPANLSLTQDHLETKSLDDIYQVKVQKDFDYKNNNIIIGTEYIKKKLHGVETYNNDVLSPDPEFVNNSIASLYIQDDYLLRDSQLLTASVKANHYDSASNRDAKIFHTLQARLGYIYSSDGNMIKLFASSMQLPTEQFLLASTNQNEIDILRIMDYSIEVAKSHHNHKIALCFEYVQNENPDSEENLSNDVDRYYHNYSGSLKYDYKYDAYNDMTSMVYANKIHNYVSNKIDTVYGANLRMLNSWRKFDFYNELNYYKRTNSDIDGINYNAGLRYKATQALIFSLKGTNIFNSAAKSEYKYIKMYGYIPADKSLYYPPVDQMFSMGVEYSF